MRRWQSRSSRTAHKFTIDLKFTKAKERGDIGVFERDEAEPLASSGLAVEHDRRVDDFSELSEELSHGFRGDAAGEPTDEELGCPLVLLSRYGSFWVDLRVDEGYGCTPFDMYVRFCHRESVRGP